MENRVKICWLGKKHQNKFVCFIPLTIDGTGDTAVKSLNNLQYEAGKIIKALRKAHVQCNFTEQMIDSAVLEELVRFNKAKKQKK